uniref:Uncharacterized protein n=1 Tax=Anguilla anguilla TaxID=7936 RepID=A0A0E9XP57_ANGAN
MKGVMPSSRKSSRPTMPSGFMDSPVKNWKFFMLPMIFLISPCAPAMKGFTRSGLISSSLALIAFM